MGACEGVTARPVIDDGGTVVGVDLSLEIGHAAGSAALEPVFEAEGADELSVFDPQLGREVGLDDLSEMDQCFSRSAAFTRLALLRYNQPFNRKPPSHRARGDQG